MVPVGIVAAVWVAVAVPVALVAGHVLRRKRRTGSDAADKKQPAREPARTAERN